MKNKLSISEIARRLNMSKSTVSKALGNKPGVDDETKKHIIKYANSVGYFSANKNSSDIILIMPARYKQQCSAVQRIMNEAGLEARCGVYLDKEDYIKMLKNIIKQKPRIAAVYPMHTEEAYPLLKKTEDLWFFGDLINIENTFYFGADPLVEAKLMADSFTESKKTSPVFIHSCKSVVNSCRTDIFAKLILKNGIYPVGNVVLSESANLSPPFVARNLEKYCRTADSIYCGDDLCTITEKALKKLNAEDVSVFSYPDKENLIKTAELLAKYAKIYIDSGDYPPCKYNFIK